MATAKRSFALKIVRFKSGRKKGFVAPAMDVVLQSLMTAAATVGDRHLPNPSGVSRGTTCFYVNRGKRRSGRDGYLIECVSYVNGMAPEQTTPNFAANSLTINTNPIVDPSTGQPRQVIHSYRALFFGHCAIIELEKGGGGTETLALALTNLLRTHVDPTLPRIEFLDVVGADLRKSIEAAGGVERISARLGTPRTQNNRQPLTNRLRNLKQWAGGSAVIHAEIEYPSGDNVSKGISALDEYSADNGLDAVTVHLRDGQKITGLRKFVEKRRMDIDLSPSGGYSIVDIERTMWNYLDELRQPDNDGWRIIDSQGRPSGACVVEEDPDGVT